MTWHGKEWLTEEEAIAQEAAGEFPGECGFCGCVGKHRSPRCQLKDVLIPVAREELGAYVPPGRTREPVRLT